MENSPSSGGDYDVLGLQTPNSPQRNEYMLPRYSSPDPRHPTSAASVTDQRQELCTAYTPPTTTTSAVATATATGGLLASGTSGTAGGGSTGGTVTGAAGTGPYLGYHLSSSSYYPSGGSGQGYIHPHFSLFNTPIYPQQGQIMLDSRTPSAEQYNATGGANGPQREYQRYDNIVSRDVSNQIATTQSHQNLMGSHMPPEENLHTHDRFMTNGTRPGGPSPHDVWRPY